MNETPAAVGVSADALLGSGTPPPEVPEWATTLPDDQRAWVAKAGHKELAQLVKSHRDLESYLGADKAGRGLVLPSDPEDAEAWTAVYDRLGRPKEPDAYALDKVEGLAPETAKTMATLLHETGLSQQQATRLASGYVQQQQQAEAARQSQLAERDKTETEALKTTLGPQFDRQLEAALRAARLGLDDDKAVAIRQILGPRAMVSWLAKLGAPLLEDAMPAGASGVVGVSSPLGARSEIDRLVKDPEFQTKLIAGDHATKERWDRLFKLAAG